MTRTELEDIQVRATKRRDALTMPRTDITGYGPPPTIVSEEHGEAERDLDRAMAIAEKTQIAFNMMMDSRVDFSTGEAVQMRGERDAARALADQLAAVVTTQPGYYGPAAYHALKAWNDRSWKPADVT